MKITTKITLALLALGISSITAVAQNDGPPQADNQGPGNPGGSQRQERHRPPPPPLFAALDVNHDGILESNEIANAPAELLTLDKKHTGQLTIGECLPPPHRHMGGGPGNNQFAFNDRQGPPDFGQGPPDFNQGPPNGRHGPPDDNQGPPQGPPDNGQGPPDGKQGPPDNGQGPPDNGQGPPDDNQGPPGPPNDMP